MPKFIRDIENAPPLSSEARHRLEHLKKEARRDAAQRTHGEIEFSVTLSLKVPPEHPHFFVALWHLARDTLIPRKKTEIGHPKYEGVGEWYITYRFEGDTEFFDVKAHKKRQMDRQMLITWMRDGRARSGLWQNTHHRFMRKRGQDLYIQDGTRWKPFATWKLSVPLTQKIDFYPRFSPRWWQFGQNRSFNTLTDLYKITDVKTVDIAETPHVYLQLYDTEEVRGYHRAKQIEIYTHPHPGVHPKYILLSTKTGGHYPVYEEEWFSRPKPVPGKSTYSESVTYDYITSELAEYEPGLWFLKTVTEERFPSAANPIISTHTPIPDSLRKNRETAPLWKRVMKVHRAVFHQTK